MSTLKIHLLKRKSEKFRREIVEFSKNHGGVSTIFKNEISLPTESQFEEICIAAKYGPLDPLFAGGEKFAIGHLIKTLNNAVSAIKVPDDQWEGPSSGILLDHKGKLDIRKSGLLTDDGEDPPTGYFRSTEPHAWANLIIQCLVSNSLVNHLGVLSPGDFQYHPEKKLYLNTETSQYGFRILVDTLLPASEFPVNEDFPEHTIDATKSRMKSNEHFTLYTVQFGVLSDFDDLDDPTGEHGVKDHLRHLQTGKVVPVKKHQRKNPSRGFSRKYNHDQVSHVVYQAYDIDGVLRYIGEGTEGRPQHVNSGASHHWRLNHHFFLRGPMQVKIFASGLSKEEALAIEFLEIKKHSCESLWNVKDNEFAPISSSASAIH
jgi:hypothetical protein